MNAGIRLQAGGSLTAHSLSHGPGPASPPAVGFLEPGACPEAAVPASLDQVVTASGLSFLQGTSR